MHGNAYGGAHIHLTAMGFFLAVTQAMAMQLAGVHQPHLQPSVPGGHIDIDGYLTNRYQQAAAHGSIIIRRQNAAGRIYDTLATVHKLPWNSTAMSSPPRHQAEVMYNTLVQTLSGGGIDRSVQALGA